MKGITFALALSALERYISGAHINSQNIVSLPLSDEVLFLTTNFSLNGNEITFLLDSGSSDAWVFASDLCAGYSNSIPATTAGKNTSFVFETEYFGGQAVEGFLYVADTATLDTAVLKNSLYYGLIEASENTVTTALLGIAKPKMQSQLLFKYKNGYNGTYPSLLSQLGGRQTYFIDLPNQNFQIGSHVKGEVTVPMITNSSYYSIKIDSVAMITDLKRGNEGMFTVKGSESFPVILDSGSSVLQLPEEITASVTDQFEGLYWDPEQQSYMLSDCPAEDSQLPLVVLSVNGKNIKIRGKDLVVEVAPGICALAITPSDFGVLGVPFFRSGSVGIDLDHQVINWAGLIR